jgi:thiamine-monophosphate kinase
MDLSDGLARDLPRLLGPGLGADIDLPMPHPDVLRFMRVRGETDPVAAGKRHAFLGGEDYALIGTCSPELAVHVMVANAETTMLGKVTENGGIRVDGVPFSGGFDHFAD